MPFRPGTGVSRSELREELNGAVAALAQLIRPHGGVDQEELREELGRVVDGLTQLHVKVDALDSKLDEMLWEFRSGLQRP